MDYHLSTSWAIALVLLAVWEVVWKGLGLWRSGRNNQINWFIAILLVNSAGILPIIYLLTQKSDKLTLK